MPSLHRLRPPHRPPLLLPPSLLPPLTSRRWRLAPPSPPSRSELNPHPSIRVPLWGLPLAEGVFGTVSELYCEVGARVQPDEAVAMIDTDKVAFEIKATCAGVVTAIHVAVGEEVRERQVVYSLKRVMREEEQAESLGEHSRQRAWARRLAAQKQRQQEEADREWELLKKAALPLLTSGLLERLHCSAHAHRTPASAAV